MTDFLTPIVRTFADVLAPLSVDFGSAEELELFLLSHGWDSRVDPVDEDAIRGAFAIVDLVEAAIDKMDVLINGTDEARVRAVLDLLAAAKAVVDRMDALASVATAGLPFPFDQQGFWDQIALELLDELTVGHLERRHPFFFALLHILGVIRFERQAPAGNGRLPYIRTKLYWDELPKILTGPGDLFKDLYKWDTPGSEFRHDEFVRAVERAVLAFKLAARVGPPRPSLSARLDPAVVTTRGLNELEIPLVEGVASDGTYWRIGGVVLPVPDAVGTNSPPRGLLITPLLQGELTTTIRFARDIGLQLTGAFDANGVLTSFVYPDRASVETDLAALSFVATMALFGDPESPWLLIGSRNGPRLELDGFLAQFGVQGTLADPEILFSVGTGEETNKVRLIVSADDGDGFVQKLIGDGFTLEFGANLHWSSKHGLSFDGSAALEFQKAIHLALGPLMIETVYVQARVGTSQRLEVGLGAGIKAVLGPLVIVVENIGLRVALVPTAPGQRGAFGSLDVDLGFKPPNGVGLSVDAGAVKGGGYLYFDFDKEEYAGALELTISGSLSLKAIGLVTTRMPDGSKGFSLLIIITAEFGTGIQLGMGFTLIGVGGLLGLNRTVKLQVLADGVRSGAVNNIMFPTDVVANAPRIISDLRAIFPVKEGTFLIGPMAKLGYGTPPLITLSLGVIIEIPGNIAILGVLRCRLPEETSPVLVLQVAFVGAWEFDKKRLWLFAGLFDSHVLTFTLEGELGVLVAYGDDANFVVSVGGFHPRFTAPPLPFPVPKRLAIAILNESNARIRCDTYFAITTNTVQFGAHAELYFGYGGMSLEGQFAFDALFQFSPFYFIIELGASISVKVFGTGLFSVDVHMALEGPTPWHAHGTGSISFLFFSISATFDVTWGEEDASTLPPIEVLPLLLKELTLAQNWLAELPAANRLFVSLRKLDAEKDGLMLHPVGRLRIAQRAAPLGLTLDTVGNQKPSDANQFTLAVTSAGLTKAGDAQELFAPAQYRSMSPTAKLSQPAFVRENAGLTVSAAGAELRSSEAIHRVVRYEQVIIDTNFKRFVKRFTTIPLGLFTHLLRGNAAAKSAVSARGAKERQPFTDRLRVSDEGFAIAQVADNRLFQPEARYGSQAAAEDALARTVGSKPGLAGTLHIVADFELNEVRAA